MSVTGGVVKYGQTRKIADYEGKRGDVELSFAIEDGQDPAAVIASVGELAQQQLYKLLNLKAPAETVVETGNPRTKAELVQELAEVGLAPKRGPGRPPGSGKPKVPPVIAPTKPPSVAAADEVQEPAPEPQPELPADLPKDITDIELTQATTRHNGKHNGKIGATIKKLIVELCPADKAPSLAMIPQGKRKEYLDRLAQITP